MRGAVAAALLMLGSAGCAVVQGTGAPDPGASGAGPTATVSDSSLLVPPGYGSLRQEDVALRLRLPGVQVRLVPLDESIIRLLAPDSYRPLRDIAASRSRDIEALAASSGVARFSAWYGSFFGEEPDARFDPAAFTITSGGREYRPLQVLPLTAGFGEHRLRQRETQTAILLFDPGLAVNQPLTLGVDTVRTAAWQDVLRRLEAERARVRGRVGGAPATTPGP